MAWFDRWRGGFGSVMQSLAERGVRGLAVLAFLAGVFALYGWTQFRGLREPAAMEYAQLARQVAAGRGFSTLCVRPVDLWQLSHARRAIEPRRTDGLVPETRHAPLYPWVLAQGFRALKPSFVVPASGRIFAPEREVIAPLGVVCAIGVALLTYLAAARLFDRRVAVTSAILLCAAGPVVAGAFSGTPLTLRMLLATASLYAAVVAATNRARGLHLLRWLLPACAAAVLAGLAALSGYALAAALGLLLAMYLWHERGGWAVALGVLLVMAGMLAPWLARNVRETGAWLGAAPMAMLNERDAAGDGAFDRQLKPDVRAARAVRLLKLRLAREGGRVWDDTLRHAGGGALVSALFLVSFFARFERDEAGRLRWCLLAGLGLLLFGSALGFPEAAETLPVFLPLATVFGVALCFLVSDRLGVGETAGWDAFLAWLLVAVNAAPLALQVASQRAGLPYPPYYPPLQAYVGSLFEPDEVLCTDIPWATAWYGNRLSVLRPDGPAEFRVLQAGPMPCAGLYLTSPAARHPAWDPVVSGAVPPDFPFRDGVSLPSGSRDQVLLADRPRWHAPGPPAAR